MQSWLALWDSVCVCVLTSFHGLLCVWRWQTALRSSSSHSLTSFFGLTLLKLPAFQGRLSQTDAFTQWQSYHTAVQETRTNKPLCDSPVLHVSDLQTSSSRLLQTLKQKRKSKIVFTSAAPPAESNCDTPLKCRYVFQHTLTLSTDQSVWPQPSSKTFPNVASKYGCGP